MTKLLIKLLDIEMRLSPENLSEDGMLIGKEREAKERRLLNDRKNLIKQFVNQFGREPSDNEIWNADRRQSA